MDGNLHIGRGHSYLAVGSSVQAMNYPTVFRNEGLNIDNAWIRIGEFETSMSNYVIDSKVFYNGPIKNMP